VAAQLAASQEGLSSVSELFLSFLMRATRNNPTILLYLLILIPFSEMDVLSSSMQFHNIPIISFLLRQFSS
jgi:hypothetical protein